MFLIFHTKNVSVLSFSPCSMNRVSTEIFSWKRKYFAGISNFRLSVIWGCSLPGNQAQIWVRAFWNFAGMSWFFHADFFICWVWSPDMKSVWVDWSSKPWEAFLVNSAPSHISKRSFHFSLWCLSTSSCIICFLLSPWIVLKDKHLALHSLIIRKPL